MHITSQLGKLACRFAGRCARWTIWLLVAAVFAQGVALQPISRAWLPETFEQGEGPADSRELPVEEEIASFSSPASIRFAIAPPDRTSFAPHSVLHLRSSHSAALGIFADLAGRNGCGAPLRC